MRLKLVRDNYTKDSTIGSLFIDNVFECYVLEDPVRRFKLPSITAIPSGVYDIDITMSARFKVEMPILLDVPGYTGIRIHPGNTARDTKGCLLPGRSKGENVIYQSRRAYDELFLKLRNAKVMGEKIVIEIIDTREPVI